MKVQPMEREKVDRMTLQVLFQTKHQDVWFSPRTKAISASQPEQRRGGGLQEFLVLGLEVKTYSLMSNKPRFKSCSCLKPLLSDRLLDSGYDSPSLARWL